VGVPGSLRGPPGRVGFGLVFRPVFGPFLAPAPGPHFPPLFWPWGPSAPKRGPFSAPFWPLFRLFPPFGALMSGQSGPWGSPGGSLPGLGRFLPVLGLFWAPFRGPPAPEKGPSFSPSLSGPGPFWAPKGPKRPPKPAKKGPFWAPFWPVLAVSRPPAGKPRAKSVVPFGGPKGPFGPPPGPDPLGPGRSLFGLFWVLSCSVFGLCFGPLFSPGFVLWGVLLALFWVAFWACFCPFWGPEGPPKRRPKALVYRASSRQPVGFRVKSPFWRAHRVPKWVTYAKMALFRSLGQAGVYYTTRAHGRTVPGTIQADVVARLLRTYWSRTCEHYDTLSFLTLALASSLLATLALACSLLYLSLP